MLQRRAVAILLMAVLVLSIVPTASARDAADTFVIGHSAAYARVLGTDGRFVVWDTSTQSVPSGPIQRDIFATDLTTDVVTLVSSGSWDFDSSLFATFNAGIIAWGMPTGEQDAIGRPLYAIVTRDLQSGAVVELATDATGCAAVQYDGRVTWCAPGGVWLGDPRGGDPPVPAWPDGAGTFYGVSGDSAIGERVIEVRGKYGYDIHAQLVARRLGSGEETVLDDGWLRHSTPNIAGVVGEHIAYSRLYPTPEEAERGGEQLAVTTVDRQPVRTFAQPTGCTNLGIWITGDERYLFVSCHGDAVTGGADLWASDLETGRTFVVTLDQEFPVFVSYGGGLLGWSQEQPDGSWLVLGTPLQHRLPGPGWSYFPETGHYLRFGFQSYWEANGGLPVFGYPLTEEFSEANPDIGLAYTVQYLERQRFEWHPENAGTPYAVLLGRLGAEEAADWGLLGSEPFQPLGPGQAPGDGCVYFDLTGHYVCGAFRDYWQGHGLDFGDPGVSERESLALFGYPLSEPLPLNDENSETIVAQFFERAVFEWHPGNPDPYKVLLRRLGAEAQAGFSG